jgi:prepilin-type N-terminal cleavage/methylation domain-containing protein
MALNQNETRGVGMRNSDCGIRNSRSRDAMHRAASPIRNSKPEIRNAFTLTELLVVITIIAVLAGLATNAAINALNAGKRTVITLELQQLATAVEQFKNDYGAYPPNGMSSGKNYGGNEVFNTIQSDFERMFTKAFPRSQEPKGLIRALAGDTTNNMSGLPGGMTSAEAVVFWLGGFSKDPQFPITGTGGPSFSGSDEVLESRNRSYEFDLGRLVPRNSTNQFDDSAGKGRFIEYTDPRNNSIRRRINLWLYTPGGSQLPLAYFDTSRHDPDEYDPDLSGGTSAGIFAIKKLREGFDESATPTVNDIVYANTKKYQLLHPGLDDEWGDLSGFSIANATSEDDASAVSVFPTGPFIGDIADTLSNFTTGTLEAAQE